jgi:hypothetical protein
MHLRWPNRLRSEPKRAGRRWVAVRPIPAIGARLPTDIRTSATPPKRPPTDRSRRRDVRGRLPSNCLVGISEKEIDYEGRAACSSSRVYNRFALNRASFPYVCLSIIYNQGTSFCAPQAGRVLLSGAVRRPSQFEVRGLKPHPTKGHICHIPLTTSGTSWMCPCSRQERFISCSALQDMSSGKS